jgi:hypothetical protein
MEAWHAYSVRAELRLERGDAADAQQAATLAVDAAEAMGLAPLAMSPWIGAQAAFSLGQPVEPAAARLQALAASTCNPRAAIASTWLYALQAAHRGDEAVAGALARDAAASMQRLVAVVGSGFRGRWPRR